MNMKPIGPALHGALDYGVGTLTALAPSVLDLNEKASAICYSFATTQGMLNAFTEQPFAVNGVVPFSMHGRLDLALLPVMLAVPYLAGAMERPKERLFFFSLFGMVLTTFLLTDFDAQERGRR